MTIEPDRWDAFQNYSREVFAAQDEHLAGLQKEAVEAGLPDIAISPDVGRLLMILASLTRAELAIEVGTLGGYSGIWIARGLAPGGKLFTIESDNAHADFAQHQFNRAGVAERVEIRRGSALRVLPGLLRELGEKSVDFAFIDAEKTEYPAYFEVIRPLMRVGSVLTADNVFGTYQAVSDTSHPAWRAIDCFNRMIARDGDFQTVAVPLRQGVLIARRVR